MAGSLASQWMRRKPIVFQHHHHQGEELARKLTTFQLIKLTVLVLFAIIGFTAFNADHFSNFFAAGFSGVSGAAGTIFFSFIGLDAVATAGEEVRIRRRHSPARSSAP